MADNEFEKAIAHLATATQGGTKFELPREEITFEVDPSCCRSGAFTAPFRLTLRGATPAAKAEAEKRAAGRAGFDGKTMPDPMMVALRISEALAFVSIQKFNGGGIDAAQKELLWDLLGEGGQSLVQKMYQEGLVSRLSDEAAEKANATLAAH